MKDAYQAVTDHVLSSIDDAGEWRPCWRGANNGRPVNHVSGHAYNGVNILTCWVEQMLHGYTSQRWATYRQWHSVGGQVRKGERGTPIILYKNVEATKDGSNASYRLMRTSHVFNLDQVDGVSLDANPAAELTDAQRLAHIEDWMTAIQFDALITHTDEGRAYYRPSTDTITMPRFESFITPEHYYAVLAHELVHWTGAKHRLERPFAARGVDRETYAKEELVAELGAAFLAADFGIETVTRDDHTAYLAAWLEALKKDKRLIVTAASQASRAADMLNAIAHERQRQMKEAA